MARYFCSAKMTPEGVAGLRAGGYAKRSADLRTIWESVGASVESVFYPLTPEWTVVLIVNASSDDVFSVWSRACANSTTERGDAIEIRTGEEADAATSKSVTRRTLR